jgi:ATP synthase protein I
MKREKNLYTLAGEYSSLAFVLPLSCLVGYAIGYYLDKYFETHFLYIIFLLLGAASGLVQLYRQVSKDTKDDDGA